MHVEKSKEEIISEFFYSSYTRVWPSVDLKQMLPIYCTEFNRLLHALTQKEIYLQEFARNYKLAIALRSNLSAKQRRAQCKPTDARHASLFYVPPNYIEQPYSILPTINGVEFKYYGQTEVILTYDEFFENLKHYADILFTLCLSLYDIKCHDKDGLLNNFSYIADNAEQCCTGTESNNIRTLMQVDHEFRKLMSDCARWNDAVNILRSRYIEHSLKSSLSLKSSHGIKPDVSANHILQKVQTSSTTLFTGASKVELKPRDIVSFKQLDCANTLQKLTVEGCLGIADFDYLGLCTHLKSLVLRHMEIRDINFVAQLKELEELILAGNLITDIQPITALPRLAYLYLAGNQIKDFSVLETLPRLREVFVDDQQANMEHLRSLSVTGNITVLHIDEVAQREVNGVVIPKWSISVVECIKPRRKRN